MTDGQPTEHILQFFAPELALPQHQAIAGEFCDLAINIIMALPRNPERSVALRKLLEARDAALRAAGAKP